MRPRNQSQREEVISVAVVLLVILIGCSGVFDGTKRKIEAVTPAAVPTDEPMAMVLSRFALCCLTAARVENASAFVAAHDTVFDDTSFRIRKTIYRIVNGTTVRRIESVRRIGSGG